MPSLLRYVLPTICALNAASASAASAIATAEVVLSNFQMQAVGGAVTFPSGPTYVYGGGSVNGSSVGGGYSVFSNYLLTAFLASDTYGNSTHVSSFDGQSMTTRVSANAAALNELIDVNGNIQYGSTAIQFPNMIISSHTTVWISFDVSTDVTFAANSGAFGQAAFTSYFAGRSATAVTCKGGFGPYRCHDIDGIPSAVHVAWSVTAGEADLATNFQLAMLTFIEARSPVVAIPEPEVAGMMIVGLPLVLAARRRRRLTASVGLRRR